MKSVAKDRVQARAKRRTRVRKKVRGTDKVPRLCVFRSLRYTYAQVISDQSGKVLTAASSREVDTGDSSARTVEGAEILGRKIAELAKEKGIEQVIFDRNGYLFHGRVAGVAKGARDGGLRF